MTSFSLRALPVPMPFTLSTLDIAVVAAAVLATLLIRKWTKPSYLKNLAGPPNESFATGENQVINCGHR